MRASKTCMSLRFKKVWGAAPQRDFSGNMAGARRAITTPKFSIFFHFHSYWLHVVLGPVSVDELVSVENAHSAPLRSAPGFR